MLLLEILFWLCLGLVFYTYLGYGVFLFLLVKIKGKQPTFETLESYPTLTLIVPAYNEAAFLAQKISNCLELDYPKDKIKYLFVIEGSTDDSADVLAQYPDIQLLNGTKRRGKIEAMNLAMQQVDTEIVVFTDANTLLNQEALHNIVRHYQDPKVGAVAGEKRILQTAAAQAAGAGEGLYWKYESFLKRLDSQLKTAVGAAGELFSIRTQLFEPVEKDTILDDFMISMRLTAKDFRVIYEPDAYALEKPSFSIAEELKRKIRISAGGFQSMARLPHLLNPFRYGWTTFEYVSHRLMRWAVAPFCLLVILLSNLFLPALGLGYQLLLLGQLLFYMLAILGYFFEKKQIKIKVLFVPFYFCFMNYAVYLGLWRYLRGAQSSKWEKSKRAD